MVVSIIVPIYNGEKYILKCLDSFKNQQIELEVICVDDGSTDSSAQLIREYSKRNKFVKYIYQENAGAPAARNNGLIHATGKYCMFFDADDVICAGALKRMINALEESDADIVIGDYSEINENGLNIRNILMRDYVINQKEKWFFTLCPPLPGNKLFLKSVIDESDLRFEHLKIGQDLNLYIKLLACCRKPILLNCPTMNYRIVNGSISRQYSKKILDICNSIDNIKEFYFQNGFADEYNKYVGLVELIAYRSQLEKLKKFTNLEEKKYVKNKLKFRAKSCRKPTKELLGKYYKEKLKILYLLLINAI